MSINFTKLNMKTKYVFHGPIRPHASFFVNRLVGTVILLVKNCRWGKEKRAVFALSIVIIGLLSKKETGKL